MSRWYFLIPLGAISCALGCSSEDRNQLAMTTPPRAAASLAPPAEPQALAPDHVAQRPPSPAFADPAKTDSLPLWPPTTAPAAPLAPSSAPPTAPPSVATSPVPDFVPPADAAPPAFTPPQFTQPQFAPALPPVDPPASASPEDSNPLRGSAATSPPTVAAAPAFPSLPSLPKPVAPAIGAGNPLRAGSADVPDLPLLPHAPAESPGTASSATASPIVPLPAFPAPKANPPAETEPAAAAPVESAEPEPVPEPTPPPAFPAITTKAAPSRLPRVSIYSSPQPSALAPAQSFAAQPHVPSGGSAMRMTQADIDAYGPPPAATEPSESQPRMLTLGTKTEPPAEPAPSDSAAPAPEAVPALPPLAVPPASPAPPADPPAFAPAAPITSSDAPPPTADPPAVDPPSFAPPMFDSPAAESPAAPESQPAIVELPAIAPEVTPEVAPAEPSEAIEPQATTALVPPVTGNEPYDVVRVFYGTDRLPVLVNQDTLWRRIARFLPALVLIALSVFGIGVVWISRKITWLIGTSALMFCSALAVWHGVTETVAIARLAEKEEPRYSAERSERGRVELGICEVAIPKTHKPGELEAPQIWRFEREYDPAKHVTLRKTARLQHDAFYEQLRAQVASSPNREVLIFVHGFNVSFEDAARRTAQMANDLKLQGAPVFYSWPADKYFLLTYGKDEASVGWAAPHLKEFLLDVVHNTDARAINLVAHSMGNRALTTALREIDLQLRDEARIFNQVVLAAPDIDADDFRDNIAPAIQRTAKQVTLYASKNDIALGASRIFHRNPRAGDTSRGLVLVAGMHTIDVSNIDGGPWGHSYYGASDPVLRDLHLLLTSLPPERRTWLKMDELDGQTYWAFKPLGMASGPAVGEPR